MAETKGTIDFSVAMEIIDVVNKFEYQRPLNEYQIVNGGPELLRQYKQDIGQSIVLFLSGRAENIYPVEPGIFEPGYIETPRRRQIINYEGRGADDDVRE